MLPGKPLSPVQCLPQHQGSWGGSPSWGELSLPCRKLGSVLPAMPGGTWAMGGSVWWVAHPCSCSRELFWREPSPRKKGFSPALPLAVNTLSSLALVAARGSRGELCGVFLGLSPPAGASICSGNGVAHPTGDAGANSSNSVLSGVLVPAYPRTSFFQLFLGINKSQLRAGECTLADLQLNGGSVQWVLTPLGDQHKLSATT